jgi:hypothetical protein
MVCTVLSIGLFGLQNLLNLRCLEKMFMFPISFYNVRHILYKFSVHYMISVPFYNVYNLYII